MISQKALIFFAVCVAIGVSVGWLLGREFGDVQRGLEIGTLLGILAGFARGTVVDGDGGIYVDRSDDNGGSGGDR